MKFWIAWDDNGDCCMWFKKPIWDNSDGEDEGFWTLGRIDRSTEEIPFLIIDHLSELNSGEIIEYDIPVFDWHQFEKFSGYDSPEF